MLQTARTKAFAAAQVLPPWSLFERKTRCALEILPRRTTWKHAPEKPSGVSEADCRPSPSNNATMKNGVEELRAGFTRPHQIERRPGSWVISPAAMRSNGVRWLR
jgi:hypothetical protein